MPRVLMIAPSFAPSSYPPALRNRNFALHLKSLGWEPLVLTVEPRFLEEPADADFLRMLPPDLEVIRVSAVSQRLTRLFGFGNLGLRSLCSLEKKAEQLIRERGIEVLFISGPPWYTFLAGCSLKKKTGVKLVLDYIDPWVGFENPNAFFLSKAALSSALAKIFDKKSVQAADAVVSVSEGINQDLKRRYPESAGKVSAVIPYGIEAADFEWVKKNPVPNRFFQPGDGLIHFVYAGVIWKAVLPTLEAALQALAILKNENPAFFARIRWHFVGSSYSQGAAPQVLPLARKYGVESAITEEVGRVPYPQALGLLCQADALLALGSDASYYSPSKVFPYLLSGAPILAVYFDSTDATSLFKQSPQARLVTFDTAHPVSQKIEAIKTALVDVASLGRINQIQLSEIENYSAKKMSEKLAGVFSRVMGRAA